MESCGESAPSMRQVGESLLAVERWGHLIVRGGASYWRGVEFEAGVPHLERSGSQARKPMDQLIEIIRANSFFTAILWDSIP